MSMTQPMTTLTRGQYAPLLQRSSPAPRSTLPQRRHGEFLRGDLRRGRADYFANTSLEASALSASASIASSASVRDASAASGLRSKYQRNASRTSASAGGRTSTGNRVTVRSVALALRPRAPPSARPRAAPVCAAGDLSSRRRRSQRRCSLPGCRAVPPQGQSAHPQGDPRRPSAVGPYARSCSAVYSQWFSATSGLRGRRPTFEVSGRQRPGPAQAQ